MKVKTEVASVPRQRVRQELGMTESSLSQDLQTIKAWLLKQPHLPRLKSDSLSVCVDEWLENVLIISKNSVERAKAALDLYFTCRVTVPEVFTNRDPFSSHFQMSSRAIHLGVSPAVNSHGDRSFVFSHTRPCADDFEPTYMMMRGTMLLDIMLLEGHLHLGVHIIVDFSNVVFAQLTRYNLALTKKVIEVAIKAHPHRVRMIHIINPSSVIEYSVGLLKQLLTKKLQNRVMVHKDPSDLVKMIGAEIVPADFGGSAPNVAQINGLWEEKCKDYRDWFLASDKLKSDESKRATSCGIETGSEFGHQGSFRKIEVD